MLDISRRGLLVGSSALVATAAVASRVAESPTNAGLSAAIEPALAAKAIPGMAVAIFRHGRTKYAKGFGQRDLVNGAPVIAQSSFRIGSLTKQFTAAAAIKLSALGKLDLVAPIAHVLPAFKRLPTVTTLELMHQTAGLHSDEGEGPTSPLRTKSQVELAAEIAAQPQPFDFEPGSAWLYSNANYIVLGAVIEQVTGRPLAAAMRDLVFDPLHLSGLAFDTAEARIAERVFGYSTTDDPTNPFVPAPMVDPSQAGGAGAMRGTVADLCKWHHALLSRRLFDQAHLDLMLRPGRLRDGRPASSNRFSPDDAHYGDTDYACGLLITGRSEPRQSILHYGSFYGFCGLLQTYRSEGVTFAALCNTDLGPAVPFRGLRKAVIDGWLNPSRS